MTNLFSIFDPSSIFRLDLNWLRSLAILLFIPSFFWVIKRKFLVLIINPLSFVKTEFKMSLTPGISFFLVGLFIFIVINNFLSLFPFVFRTSRHLRFSITFAIPVWVGYIIYSTILNLGIALAHLVHLGTPRPLTPFIVLIEIIRQFIRPTALSVRLAANIIAGHTLIVVLAIPFRISFSFMVILRLRGVLILIFILEVGVRLVQGYVFSALICIFVIESNNPNLS